MRRREIEFRGHEKFTNLHAAVLVFCLEATGYFLLKDGPVQGRRLPVLWILFLAPSWYGLWLLALQCRSPQYRVFGLLLAAVNAVWSLVLVLGGDSDGIPLVECLAMAGALSGLGVLVTLHSFALARRPASRAATSARR